MLSKIINMSYDRARFEFLKELDTAGIIGSMWISEEQQIVKNMMDLDKFIGTWDSVTTYPPNRTPLPLIDTDLYDMIIRWNLHLPTTILLYSKYDWDSFVSEYMIFINKACELTLKMLGSWRTPETEKAIDADSERVKGLVQSFEPIINLARLAASYDDLIQAGNDILQQLKAWSQSRPAAVQLSEAYLKAIGFYPEDHDGPGPGSPPPPAPPPKNNVPPDCMYTP